MHLILNYLIFILITISKTITFANEQNSERPQQTVKTAGLKTRKISKLGRDHLNDPREELPLSTEVRWKRVDLSDVSSDLLNLDGFINVACYTELTEIPSERLYNKTFRIDVPKILEETNKHCMLRFPVGMYLQYRFKFDSPNTYVFFALGNSANLTVATTRLISSTELYDRPFNWWKGIIHVPCRFATLVFRPYIAGEIFEFKFLEIVPNIIDKCSKLEYEYFH
ncbi:hypothetical protein ACQ4LE_003734 [Meloidogyne hapla]